jgi:hypothetical protein
VAEWSIALVLKTRGRANTSFRGFESYRVRMKIIVKKGAYSLGKCPECREAVFIKKGVIGRYWGNPPKTLGKFLHLWDIPDEEPHICRLAMEEILIHDAI